MTPMTDKTLAVYGVIQRSMPKGATAADVVLALAGKVGRTPIYTSISNLLTAGYLRFTTQGNQRTYFTTAKVPAGYDGPVFAAEEEESTEALFNNAPPPAGKPPGVPNSVFQLGAMAAPAQAQALPKTKVAEPVAKPAAQPLRRSDAYLNWKAPAAAASPAAPAEPAAAVAGPAAAEPRFAIGSDDCLDIVDGELQVRLKPETTRALFRWLDRVGRAYASLLEELPA